ncbi:unnamed protein product [Trichobilharzia regenti]|nr:unnamed protein product [Trichobilharzia regenti]
MTSETVSINDLTIPQLQELARQMEQKIQFLSASIQQLKALQTQFTASKNCLTELTPEKQNNDILVPLTSTLCVPGKLSDTSHVLVDIGTGYYVEMVCSFTLLLSEFSRQFPKQRNILISKCRKLYPFWRKKHRFTSPFQ